MTWLEVAAEEASDAKTGYLLCLVALASLATQERHRLRPLFFFTGLHLTLLAILVGLRSGGSELTEPFRVPTWVLGSVAFVSASGAVVFELLLPRMRIRVPRILQDVVVALGSVAISLAVASSAGVNLSGLIATSAVLTAILGFSLQDTIGNIAGGLGLQLDNSIEVGDWIRVGTSPTEINGRVVDIRWRYTAVETRNWETVLVPNRVLMNSQVMVLGRRLGQPRRWRRLVEFHVDWRFQPSDVIEVARGAVRGARIQGMADEPMPSCVLVDMAESYGRYVLRYWLTDLSADDATDSEVRTRIFFALERAGIKLALPAHALFVTQESGERQEIKTQKQIERRRSLLETVELLRTLSPEEREGLARKLKYAPFARGEMVTRQGEDSHWLYLIEEGRASVRVSDGASEREVADLGPGDVFGEMSLLTGAPRAATVMAETDLECFRLEKGAFQRILEERPALAEQLATLLSERGVELQAARQGLDAEAAERRASSKGVLVDKIRRFFGLE